MSRHGKIAESKALLSVNIGREIKEQLASLAAADRRTLSAFVALHLERLVTEEQNRQAALREIAGESSGEIPPARPAKGK